MRLLPIKVRPECESYYASYYIQLSPSEQLCWRCHVNNSIDNSHINNKDDLYWMKYT